MTISIMMITCQIVYFCVPIKKWPLVLAATGMNKLQWTNVRYWLQKLEIGMLGNYASRNDKVGSSISRFVSVIIFVFARFRLRAHVPNENCCLHAGAANYLLRKVAHHNYSNKPKAKFVMELLALQTGSSHSFFYFLFFRNRRSTGGKYLWRSFCFDIAIVYGAPKITLSICYCFFADFSFCSFSFCHF